MTAQPALVPRLLMAVLCVALIVPCALSADNSSGDFALVGDPQIGYGHGEELGDAARFGRVVEDIRRRSLGLTVIAGDMVQDRSLWQNWLFARAVRRLPGTVLLVPGNHDIVDRASLADWRKRHGPDYRDLVWRNVAFILLDSETLRDTRISASETMAQWIFLEQSLAAHAAAGREHIVLVMHRPPFVVSEDEAGEDANWPPASRAKLLFLARAHGVRWILAGHLHRTTEISTHDGIRIIVGAGSARSFDHSPVAYHSIRITQTGFGIHQVVVASAAPEPFTVPGLPEWTPRIFEFSLRHWLFTMAYAGVGAIAFIVSRRSRSSRWLAVSILLVFFAANMQLDFDELVRETGRLAARATGVYAVRHLITGGVTVLTATIMATLFACHWRRSGERLSLLALGLLVPPVAWFCLSSISHHSWGMLFNESWWDLLIVLSLMGILACGVRNWHTRPAQKLSSGRR